MTGLRVERLRCEHLTDPRGVDRPRPRLSWQVRSDRRGTMQQAYRILAASSPELLREGSADLWDSGRMSSEECVLVPFGGPDLVSRQQVFWSVCVWAGSGEQSPYAHPATFEMALLDPTDWSADWIAGPAGAEPSAVTYLHSTLRVDAPVRRARAYATALGIYELRCNGTRVGDARFTPGWTDYAQRLQYQVLDLTDLFVVGDNELTALLADGWYAGYIGFQGTRGHYGDTPQLLAQIEVETDDGRLLHTTGAGWTAGRGAIRTSDMLKGETYDGQTSAEPLQPVRRTGGTPARRVVSPAPPVRALDEVAAVSVERVGDVHRVDFGQNLVGWVRLRVSGSAGTTLTVRHAEILQPDGSLYVENLRTADAVDRYVLGANGPCLLEPSFTFHGFRYAEVSGLDSDLRLEHVTAVVCGSDLERVGDFSCSDEAVNQLHSNIVWGARSNFFDIPTDCPQRDERMGWTGDAQVFAPTACDLFDTAGFFTKWLRDLADAQTTEGSIPDVVPRVILAEEGSAGWADAGVIVPSVLWERYADGDLFAEMYPVMRRWVDYVHRANPGLLWLNARSYDNGDWLAAHAETDKDLIATAYFARSARLTARAAEVVGRADEARELHALADGVAAAFREAYLLPGGQLKCETQTAYALALQFDLLPADAVSAAVAHLAADVEAHDTHLTTGFLGVAQLLPALAEGGRSSLAYRLLHQDGYPSWLYAVRAGATTVWERWDGWTAEAGYGDPAMNSYNHYALGSVGEWLYSGVAGIRYDAPGGRRLQLSPLPDESMTWAQASHRSPYGLVRCGWTRSEGDLRVEVEIPVSVTATLRLPDMPSSKVLEGGRSVGEVDGLSVLSSSPELVLGLGSGRYDFQICPRDPVSR
jgi:alpha-L-rhamnosidase